MSFQDLVKLMDALRGEKGCPWDKKQTLHSLKPFLIEEAYEVIEAIEQKDHERLKEELGDLLFHIVFMSKVSADMGKFGVEDVMNSAYQKMRRRHPHVFSSETPAAGARRDDVASDGAAPRSSPEAAPANQKADRDLPVESPKPDAEEVLKQWYDVKRQERARKGSTSLMDGIPRHLPALQKAEKVQQRAAEVGFDWEKPQDVLEKISEETQELRAAISRHQHADISEEMGDVLFSVVNVCRFLKVDAEDALRGTIAKFIDRFREMERRVADRGKRLRDLSLKEMDAEWEAVKTRR